MYLTDSFMRNWSRFPPSINSIIIPKALDQTVTPWHWTICWWLMFCRISASEESLRRKKISWSHITYFLNWNWNISLEFLFIKREIKAYYERHLQLQNQRKKMIEKRMQLNYHITNLDWVFNQFKTRNQK